MKERSVENGQLAPAIKFISPKQGVRNPEVRLRSAESASRGSTSVRTATTSSSIKDPSEEESFNFFACDYLEGESKLLIDEHESSDKTNCEDGESGDRQGAGSEETEHDQEEGSTGEEAFTADRFIIQRKPAATEVRLPVYVSLRRRLDSEAKTFFVPAMTEEKRGMGSNERVGFNREEDGIFVGEKPFITRTNLNILQNRLLTQGKGDWIRDSSGHVAMVDIPTTRARVNLEKADTAKAPSCIFVPPCPFEEFDKMCERIMYITTKNGILRCNIAQIQFTSHPLISKEHKIGFELLATVEKLKERSAMRITEILHEKLKVLRNSLAKLKQMDVGGGIRKELSSVHKELDTSQRHGLYLKEIKECREALRAEGKTDRELTLSVLALWKSLKDLRRDQGYQNTDLQLQIVKEELKKRKLEEEMKKWKEELEEEVEERITEEKKIYERKEEKYKKELEQWKHTKKMRVEASKRKRRFKRRRRKGLTEEEIVQLAQDEITLSAELGPKPSAPRKVNKKEVRREVEEDFAASRHPPGEPVLKFDVMMSPSVTPITSCPPSERQRRNNVKKTKISLKIYINNKLVTEVPPSNLKENFTADFSASLLIAVLTWPYEIRAEIYEVFGFVHRRIASIQLSVPGPTQLESHKVPLNTARFCSSRVKSNRIGNAPNYEGTLSFRLSWRTGEDGTPVLPAGPPLQNKVRDLGGDTSPNPDLILDPNDPRNAQIISDLKMKPKEGKATNEGFDLYGKEETFCSKEDIESSLRFRVLRLRNEGISEFKKLTMIPSLESQILKNTLEVYDKKEGRESGSILGEGTGDEFRENERKAQADSLVCSILRRLEEKTTTEPPTLKDYVREEEIPNIGSIGELLSILKPKRPLKPERKPRDLMRGVGLADHDVKLILHVTRGFHVPLRQESKMSTEETASSSEGTEDLKGCEAWGNMVRPFVEVSFQKNSARTHASQGSSPTWNEQLVLPFRPPNNDFTASNLQSIEESVYFHLYDEVIHDLLEDERLRENTVFYQKEKRWLGSLKIPFSTIYLNSKIEGTFRLECPTLMLNYVEDDGRSNEEDQTIATPLLSLYLTFEPTLPLPEPLKENFKSSEPESILRASKDFSESLSSKFPLRHFRTHVLNLFGESVSLNRYIKPLAPPQELIGEGDGDTFHRVVWYVYLLPCFTTTKINGGTPKLWSNSEQFVNLGIGGFDEKAVLLTNYLLYLGYKAFLLLGSGVPEGLSSYVLVRIGSAWNVVSAGNGATFEIWDPASPLKAVYMLVEENNIYANNQKFDDPPRMKFDLKFSSSDWKSLYSGSFPDPGLPSVQPDAIHYKPVNEEKWKALQRELEVVLRDAFMKWRPMHRTVWNSHLTKLLRKQLFLCEEASLNGKNPKPNLSKLKTMMDSHKVLGVCVHQGFRTVEQIVEAVFSTGVHATRVPGVEFSLAVEFISYPGEAASVWIYVASLSRPKS